MYDVRVSLMDGIRRQITARKMAVIDDLNNLAVFPADSEAVVVYAAGQWIAFTQEPINEKETNSNG